MIYYYYNYDLLTITIHIINIWLTLINIVLQIYIINAFMIYYYYNYELLTITIHIINIWLTLINIVLQLYIYMIWYNYGYLYISCMSQMNANERWWQLMCFPGK